MSDDPDGALANYNFVSRKSSDQRLVRRENVWGTGFGLKEVEGKLTEEHCYTVFVEKKRPKSKLSKADLIPKTVTRGGAKMPTDVVEIQKLVYQNALSVFDQVNLGTLSCFAAENGRLHGISAAHALWGPDQSNIQPDIIDVFLPQVKRWFRAGETERIVWEAGAGVPGDFGFLDAGLFEVRSPEIGTIAASASPLKVIGGADLLRDLRGLRVSGEGGVSGPCEGVVFNMYVSAEELHGRRFDIVIRSVNGEGMTRKGDSGLLWRVAGDGSALAIHLVGENRGSLGSRFSFGCFAARIQSRFGGPVLLG